MTLPTSPDDCLTKAEAPASRNTCEAIYVHKGIQHIAGYPLLFGKLFEERESFGIYIHVHIKFFHHFSPIIYVKI